MGFQKIGGGSPLQAPPYPITLAAGQTFGLPVGQGGGGQFGGAQFPQIGMGNAFSGQYIVNLGNVSELQVWNTTNQGWIKAAGGSPGDAVTVSADGKNFRIANTSGSPTGATITAAGSGYTNGFYGFDSNGAPLVMQGGTTATPAAPLTITASDGSKWNAIVGGSVNTSIAVSGTVFSSSGGSLAPFGTTLNGQTASGGSGYNQRPQVLFGPPPNQGMQPYVLPQATAAVAAGAITGVTVTYAGAGLLGLPSITIVPAAGDTTAGGAVVGWLAANNNEAGAGTVTAVTIASYGPGVPTGTTPTLTFAPAGATATAVVNAAPAANDTVTLVSL